MYSALHHNGERLYELARRGVEVERKARNVTFFELELLETDLTLPRFSLHIASSGGFYVRSLISDLARRWVSSLELSITVLNLCSMQGRAHMTELMRTKQGPFTLEDCLAEEDWKFDAIIGHIARCSSKAGLLSASLKPAINP